jgi:hypothetical protein
MSGHLNDFQHELLEPCPHALQVHCYENVLNIVFSLKWDCYRYITFKQENLCLNLICEDENNVTEERRILILGYFGSIDGREGWSANDKMAVIGTRNLERNFEQFLFSFLLFAHSEILFHILHTKVWDIVFCVTKMK